MSILNRGEKAVDLNKLSKQELETLLIIIKNTTITGEQVELFYNLIIKLQNQYTQSQK